MKRLLIALVAAVAIAIPASSSAAYYCGTPHGTVTASDSVACWLARDIVDKDYQVQGYAYLQTGFMVDGYTVECYANWSGNSWYELCIPYPHPSGSYVEFWF